MTYEQLEFVRSVCSSWHSSIVVVVRRQQRGQEATHLVRYALTPTYPCGALPTLK